MTGRPPISPLFPYTPLSRSKARPADGPPTLPTSMRTGNGRWMSSAGSSSTPTTGRHGARSEEHTSELQSRLHLVCRLLLEKKKKQNRVIGRHRDVQTSSDET